MKRIIAYLIPVLIIVGFIFLMVERGYLVDQELPGYITEVTNCILDDDWDNASLKLEKLNAEWKRIIPRMMLSAERDEITGLSINLARLKGTLLARDKGGALAELTEARYRWNNLRR